MRERFSAEKVNFDGDESDAAPLDAPINVAAKYVARRLRSAYKKSSGPFRISHGRWLTMRSSRPSDYASGLKIQHRTMVDGGRNFSDFVERDIDSDLPRISASFEFFLAMSNEPTKNGAVREEKALCPGVINQRYSVKA